MFDKIIHWTTVGAIVSIIIVVPVIFVLMIMIFIELIRL